MQPTIPKSDRLLGTRFRPYDADALQFYNDKTGDTVTVAKAQKSLEGLRARQPKQR